MRVAVASGATELHIALHEAAAQGRITLVPLPLRASADDVKRMVAAARADAVVADAAHEALASLTGLARVTEQECQEMAPGRRPYAVLGTSGTSGAPRLVEVPHAALAAHRRAAMARLHCDEDSVWPASLPLWHIGGVALVDRCLHGGGRLLLPGSGSFDGRAPLPAQTTHVSVVPTVLRRLLATPVPVGLRCVLVGGDALPPELAKAALSAGWPVHASYGLTEACSQVATATPAELERFPGTSGRPLDGVHVDIDVDVLGPTDPGTAGAGPGRAGMRGQARGSQHMLGASNAAGKIAMIGEIVVSGSTLAVPGPLRTGDLGWLDDEGRLFVVGRADDRITTGGEKVHPERVEQVLARCPGVDDVGVVGVADPAWGQRVVAFVVGTAAPEAIVAFARLHLGAPEVPKQVRAVDALPRTPGGKLRRGALRLAAERQP